MHQTNSSILALDVGGKRTGIAIASWAARLPRPLVTLINDENFMAELTKIIDDNDVDTLILGFPRGLDGQHTQQTAVVESFEQKLRHQFTMPIHLQDEAVTSKKAEAELEARGKTYQVGDIDALAANYILDDWLAQQEETN